MRNILIVTVLILAVLLTAAVTNPSRDDFINWGITEIRNQAENEIERVFGSAVAGPMLELQTEVDDYVVFSVFTLEKAEEEVKYLGIFNNFFKLN